MRSGPRKGRDRRFGGLSFCVLAFAWLSAGAADIVVYDDASHAGYDQNCSFGGVPGDFDFANAAPVHSGTASIRFTPESFDAVSWCTPLISTTNVSGVSFWVNGGASGGQNLELALP